MTDTKTISRADALALAREMLTAAHSLIYAAITVDGVPDGHAKGYVADHLRMLIDRDHGFLGGGTTVDDLVFDARGGEYGTGAIEPPSEVYDLISEIDWLS